MNFDFLTDWEFWALAWFFSVVVLILVMSRLGKINEEADRMVERHCNHADDPCDCIRHHQDEDQAENL